MPWFLVVGGQVQGSRLRVRDEGSCSSLLLLLLVEVMVVMVVIVVVLVLVVAAAAAAVVVVVIVVENLLRNYEIQLSPSFLIKCLFCNLLYYC
jgi:hypothetical protein